MKPIRPLPGLLMAVCACTAVFTATAQTQPARPRPAASAPASTDCNARWQAYQRSQVCYLDYMNSNGSIRQGARAACGPPLLDPSPQCGPAPSS